MAKIKVYFDLACPFCYLVRGFWQKMQTRFPIDMEWVPWEAHPELPPEGKVKTQEAAEVSLQKLRPLGGDIRHFEANPHVPNTHNALLGLEFSRRHGKIDEYIERVYKAYFIEARDISALTEILEIGSDVGLDKAALEKSITSKEYEPVLVQLDQEAEGMGLEVVPSFVQDGVLVLAGSQTMDFNEFEAKYKALWGK